MSQRIRLPSPIPISIENDPTDLQIARINDLTRSGRANWIGLLAYLAFAMITLLGVQDVDFFLDSRQTELPLVGVSIPTDSFFYFAPILGAALHVYVHLFVRKSTAALTAITAPTYKGEPLESHVLPWLLNDLVLRWRRDGATRPRPLDGLATVTAILLIWIAGPFVLGFAWVRAWVAHDPLMSFTGLACFLIASYASLVSWLQFHADRRNRRRTAEHRMAWDLLCTAIFLTLASLTAFRTIDGSLKAKATGRDLLVDPSLWDDTPWPYRLARAELSEQILTPLPDDWLPYEVHKQRFRVDWCARQGIDEETCGPPHFSDLKPVPHLAQLRTTWCEDARRKLDTNACTAFFTDLDNRFPRAWDQERSTALATLNRWAPTRKDLRGANLRSASLTDADLRNARLQRADLEGAELQGANLREAQLQEAYLGDAQLQGADLWAAQLQGAYLGDAQLQGAALWGAKLQGAYLGGAQLQGAELGGAQLQGAELWGAQLQGADLKNARLLGANLTHANLKSANWAFVYIDSVLASFADFRGGTSLDQFHLSSLVGNAATLLPDGSQHYVCSCWAEEPPSWSLLVKAADVIFTTEDEAPDRYLCAPGDQPMKTGTPWPTDQDPPWGDFPSWSDEAEAWAAAQPAPTEPCP